MGMAMTKILIRRRHESAQPDDRAGLARAIELCPDTKVESLREAVREISSGELVLEMPQADVSPA
jgi:hypothetical protein